MSNFVGKMRQGIIFAAILTALVFAPPVIVKWVVVAVFTFGYIVYRQTQE